MDDDKKVKTGEQNTDHDSKAVPLLSTTAGAVAGGIITSSPAITVAGGTGLAAYSAGLGSLIAHVGCGSIAAASALSLVAAGPVIGGLIGFGAYRAIKGINKKDH